MKDNIEKIIKRIKALSEKTIENGATKDEAKSAIELIAKLMSKYELSEDDIFSMRQEVDNGVIRNDVPKNEYTIYLRRTRNAIAYLTDTQLFISSGKGEDMSLFFIGLKHDAMVAEYILDICLNAVRNETEKYSENYLRLFTRNKKESKRRSFLVGLDEELAKKIRDMKIIVLSESRDLVVCKDQLIREFAKKDNLKIKFNAKFNFGYDYDEESYNKGREAAKNIQINAGLEEEVKNNRKIA